MARKKLHLNGNFIELVRNKTTTTTEFSLDTNKWFLQITLATKRLKFWLEIQFISMFIGCGFFLENVFVIFVCALTLQQNEIK